MGWFAVGAGLSLVAVACNGAEEEPTGTTVAPPGPAPVPPTPPEIEGATEQWPLGNKDYANTRATTDSEIDSTNVDELEPAWNLPLTVSSDWGAAASAPVISGDVVYFQDLMSNVWALDLGTGEEIWNTEYDRAAIGPNGPGIGWDRLYFQDGTEELIALDLQTGEELWSTELWPHTGVHQPTPYGGLIFTGTGAGKPPEGAEDAVGRESYSGGESGVAYAVDHQTGEVVWEFQVVEEGFWGDPERNSGGALWYPPGIDPERGHTYWGTGNPAPFPGTIDNPNAESRPGPNLYTNSMLALDLDDGQMHWYNQVHPSDLFDLDYQGSPVLVTAEVQGEETDLVIGSGKVGSVHAFDRDEGEIVWEVGVSAQQNHELQEIPADEETWVLPGIWGGVETPLSAADDAVYVLTTDLPTPYTATGFDAESTGDAVVASEARTPVEDGEGHVVALDIATGEELWSHELGETAFGATTVVNDLVFTATLGGRIVALDRENGEEVWSMQSPGGINAWPAVAGDTIVWPVGLGQEPMLLALRLGG